MSSVTDKILLRSVPFIFTLALLVGVISCSSDDCTDNKNALPLAAFYSSDTIPTSISLSRVSIYGIDNPYDSLLADSSSRINEIYLPFRIDNGNTSFVIDYGVLIPGQPSLADTISFTYDIKPMFVSSACGAVYFYENIRVAHTNAFIDSIRVPDNLITNKNSQNIFIYFREYNQED